MSQWLVLCFSAGNKTKNYKGKIYVRMETLDTTIHWTTYADLQENPILEVNQTMRDVNEHYPG